MTSASNILKYFWRENSNNSKNTTNHFSILARKFKWIENTSSHYTIFLTLIFHLTNCNENNYKSYKSLSLARKDWNFQSCFVWIIQISNFQFFLNLWGNICSFLFKSDLSKYTFIRDVKVKKISGFSIGALSVIFIFFWVIITFNVSPTFLQTAFPQLSNEVRWVGRFFLIIRQDTE